MRKVQSTPNTIRVDSTPVLDTTITAKKEVVQPVTSQDVNPGASLFPGAKIKAGGGAQKLQTLDLKDKVATGVDQHLATLISAVGTTNTYVVDGEVAKPGKLDLDAIGHASFFSLLLDGAKADDALVAAGVAIAHGVPSLYIVPQNKQLPWFLREADQTYPGTVRIIEEPIGSSLKKTLRDDKNALFGAPKPQPSLPAAASETFIGCLMSGLSEAQYTEGRGHLQAIDQAMREKLGAAKTHCEGIMVASTTSFGSPKESLEMDVEAVRRADKCVFYLYDPQPRPSGMWVEAGVALGFGKPCTFLVPSEDALPPCLRAGNRPDNVKVVTYADHAALVAGLAKDPAALIG